MILLQRHIPALSPEAYAEREQACDDAARATWCPLHKCVRRLYQPPIRGMIGHWCPQCEPEYADPSTDPILNAEQPRQESTTP